jgi:hypothetical protein
MSRLSFRAIVFVVVLSALHIAGIPPLKDSATPPSQEAASQHSPVPAHSFLASGQLAALPPGDLPLRLPGMEVALHSSLP